MSKKPKPLCKLVFEDLSIDQALDLPVENKVKSKIIKSIIKDMQSGICAPPDGYKAGWVLCMDTTDLPSDLVKIPFDSKKEIFKERI